MKVHFYYKGKWFTGIKDGGAICCEDGSIYLEDDIMLAAAARSIPNPILPILIDNKSKDTYRVRVNFNDILEVDVRGIKDPAAYAVSEARRLASQAICTIGSDMFTYQIIG